jgi:hypothetical protein
MAAAIITAERPQELLRSLNFNKLTRIYEDGMNLSTYFESEDPSVDYPNEKTDAFQRVMRCARIRTRSISELGIVADEFSAFDKDEGTKVLMTEFLSRKWRQAGRGRHVSTRAMYMSDDDVLGGGNNPYFDTPGAMWDKQIAPAIPIDRLVARTVTIDRDVYRAFYLKTDVTQLRKVRVGEGAEIPGAKLVEGPHVIYLYKYGRKLTMTYEQMRRQRIDVVGLHVARMAVQAEIDKLATIMDVFVNGDGNTGTAATSYNLTALDPAATVPTGLTLKAWLTFKMKFQNPYMLDTIVGQEGPILSTQLLNTGSANIPLVVITGPSNFGSFTPINPSLRDAVAYGWTADAPANQILGFDTRFGVEQILEAGATIQEVTRFITNQTEAMTMTETVGYAILDQNGNKILNLAA